MYVWWENASYSARDQAGKVKSARPPYLKSSLEQGNLITIDKINYNYTLTHIVLR